MLGGNLAYPVPLVRKEEISKESFHELTVTRLHLKEARILCRELGHKEKKECDAIIKRFINREEKTEEKMSQKQKEDVEESEREKKTRGTSMPKWAK
eukprot:14409309-Ditylum_brightwellii.AAC.3